MNVAQARAKAAILSARAGVVADLHSRADALDETIGVDLEPHIVALGSPELCGEGRWFYEGSDGEWIHLHHRCHFHQDTTGTRIKLEDLVTK